MTFKTVMTSPLPKGKSNRRETHEKLTTEQFAGTRSTSVLVPVSY